MFVEVNGARLAVDVTGAGPPVVLVHAGICDRRMWDAQVAALAPRCRAVTVDLRGHGESPPIAGRFSHWADLRGLLDALGLARVDLVGASLGGGACLDLALAAPERVGKLVLAAPAIGGWTPSAAHRERLAEVETAYRKYGLEGANDAELRMWVDGPTRRPDAVPAVLRDRVREMNRRNLEHELAEPGAQAVPLDPPAIGRLEELRAETLVIEGVLDQPDAMARAQAAATRIPGAKRAYVAGVAHLPNLEAPQSFNDTLLWFLWS